MKTIIKIALAALVGLWGAESRAADGSRSDGFRTDINPALRYYQAFLEAPQLSPEDHKYLFDTDWRGKKLPPKFGELAAKYDAALRTIREAAQATVPCDWGIDLSKGPEVLLPSLSRARWIAQAARVRTMWHLQHGQQAEARDDLVAAFVLARNIARDGVLISALVQFAMESILETALAENFSKFRPEALQQIIDGFESSPSRGTVAACIPVEKYAFRDWFVEKIERFQRENPNDDARVVEKIRDLIRRNFAGDEGQGDPNYADKVIQAAGGASDGVLKLLRELDSWYARSSALLALPYNGYEAKMKAFTADLEASPNPLVSMFFPAFGKCRAKEWAAEADLAMVRAAVAYKTGGEKGLKNVVDPFGAGPFTFARFVFEGVDRGFELKSAFSGRGFEERIIFLESDGPPFSLSGPDAGKPLPKEGSGK